MTPSYKSPDDHAAKARGAGFSSAPRLVSLRASEIGHPPPEERIPPLVSIAAVREEWPGHIAAAQLHWSELTDIELRDIEGRQPMLATLVQQRYAITQEAADEQVRSFFAKLPW
jgi:hypothetical protein